MIVKVTRGRTVISFHKEARRQFARVAGRAINLSCVTLRADPIEGATTNDSVFAILKAPKRRRPFASPIFDREHRDLCSIVRRPITRRVRGGTETDPEQRIAVVPLTHAGARYIEEATIADVLGSVIEYAAVEARRGKLPSFARLGLKRVDGFRVVPLDTADAVPPPGALGYFSDGESATAAGVADTGRRLFVMRGKEGLLSTNVSNYLADPAF